VTTSLYVTRHTLWSIWFFKKSSKIGATRRQILRLKCTKIDFGWGSAPDPHWGAYSTPPDPLAVFKGPTSKEGEGEERREREGKGKGRGGKGKGGGERPYTPPVAKSWLRHWTGNAKNRHFCNDRTFLWQQRRAVNQILAINCFVLQFRKFCKIVRIANLSSPSQTGNFRNEGANQPTNQRTCPIKYLPVE